VDAERTSFRERRVINPTTTVDPYGGSLGLVTMEITLEETALEKMVLDEMVLDEIMLNNIRAPVSVSFNVTIHVLEATSVDYIFKQICI